MAMAMAMVMFLFMAEAVITENDEVGKRRVESGCAQENEEKKIEYHDYMTHRYLGLQQTQTNI